MTAFTELLDAPVHLAFIQAKARRLRHFIPLLLGVAAVSAHAQSPVNGPDSVEAQSIAHARSAPPKLGRNTRAMLLTTVAVGGVVAVFDSRLSLGAQRLGGDDMRTPSSVGSFVGGPGPLALGAGFYVIGRLSGHNFATRSGREIMRAVVVSGALTAVLKGTVGRARPFVAPGDPDEFSPGSGFTNASLASFPSGHTSAAFATATVLARELNTEHPHQRWLTNTLLFGAASFVGFSRVYQRQHWPSDVVAGAALGSITGYEVVAHAHGDRSKIDRHLFSHVAIAPGPKGVALAWSP